jgi:hypothetical protein
LWAANALRRIEQAVRLALPLLAVLAALSLVACGGDDEEAAAPVPVAQRFVTAEDAPGSKADPVETRQTTEDFTEFIRTLSERAASPDEDEMTAVFDDAGFKGAGVDARFFGETHAPDEPHIFSSEIELESEEGAASALDWLEKDALAPCPRSCAVDRDTFDVEGVSGARGVHRSATAEDIERLGTEDQHPFDSYWIGFTIGPVVYTMELSGPPGSVSEEQAREIASAYHDRLSGG